jgi:hypothetical protein
MDINEIIDVSKERINQSLMRLANDISLKGKVYDEDKELELRNSFDSIIEFDINNFKMYLPAEEVDEFVTEAIKNTISLISVTPVLKAQKYDWYKDVDNGSWKHYKKYLLDYKNFEKQNIDVLDRTTTQMLNSFKNPVGNDSCSQKGLAIGDIQSGKTANFIGLISKAIDHKFDYIVVLTGIGNDLRNQTQKRIEIDIIGRKSGVSVGIKNIYDKYDANAFLVTKSENDIKKSDFRDFGSENPGQTAIFVSKKNTSTLKVIFDSLNASQQFNKSILIIDDEADNASIDTNANKEDSDITKINESIRKLLNIFEKNYYVAYTATPYANLFIDKEANDITHKEDLFPKDFIVRIPTSDKYTGFDSYFISKFSDKIVNSISNEKLVLKEAIYDYLINASIKKIMFDSSNRFGDFKVPHSSMMVNSSHLTAKHKTDSEVVQSFYDEFKTNILYTKEKDFVEIISKKIDEIKVLHQEMNGFNLEIENDEVFLKLKTMIKNEEFEIIEFNSATDSNNTVDYCVEYKNYIIIGGNALSRGLTIEGLLVSYFYRTTKTMDTLSQMGRWNGYRNSYLFLTKLYISKSIVEDIKAINEVDIEIKNQIDYLCEIEESPEQFAIEIKKIAGLMPTSKNKQGKAKVYGFDFSESASQITGYNYLKYDMNKQLINQAFTGLEKPNDLSNGYKFTNIDSDFMIEFLDNFANINDDSIIYSKTTDVNNWNKYIKEKNKIGELVNWTIVIKGRQKSRITETFDFGDICFAKRYGMPLTVNPDIIRTKVIVSPADEAYDLEDSRFENRNDIRKNRDPKNGLLVIYCIHNEVHKGFSLMISFPKSTQHSEIATDKYIN